MRDTESCRERTGRETVSLCLKCLSPRRDPPATKDSLVDTWLREDTQSVFVQLFRYTLVGGTAFLLDFSALFLMTRFLGIHYLMSAALAFTLGVVTNYLLSITWVFSIHRLENRVAEFGIFALIGVVGLALNEIFMWFFTERVGLYYLLSKIGAAFFVYLWNFLARRFLLFRERRAHE